MFALAWWPRWLECGPVHQKVAGSIPDQGTYLGCGCDPWVGCVQEATRPMFLFHIDVSVSLSHILFLSLESINMSSGEY